MKNFSKMRVALIVGVAVLVVAILGVVFFFPVADSHVVVYVEEPWENPPYELVGRWLYHGVPIFVINADGSGTMGDIPVDAWQVRGSELRLSVSGYDTTLVWDASDNWLTLGEPSSGPLADMLKSYSPLHWRDTDIGTWEYPPEELVGRWMRDDSPLFTVYADGTGTLGGVLVDAWRVRGSELMLIFHGAETTVTWGIIEEQLMMHQPATGPLADTLMEQGPFAWHDIGDIGFFALADSSIGATSIEFVFSAAVPDLAAGDIVLGGGLASVTRGALTGGGARWSLAVGVSRVGDLTVAVNHPGVTSAPMTVVFYLTSLRSISAGEDHTVVVRTDGSLWAWGTNRYGRLGDGTTIDSPSPTRIGADTDWVYASAGYSHTVAVKTDGSLWAWGSNEWNQLGYGAASASLVPVQIGAVAGRPAGGWASVSAGREHTMAVGADGSLWGWGRNLAGHLGDGTTTNRHVPTRIGADSDWYYVSAGRAHTVGIRTDGSLWIWGANWSGQLGNGLLTGSPAPVQVGSDTNWASVSAGRWHTMAVRSDGSLWAWGGNGSGQLGDGTTYNRHVPTRIGPDYTWASVSAGSFHSAAVRTDGSFLTWGRNMDEPFGDGTVIVYGVPTRMVAGYYWTLVSAGRDHTAAVRNDGSLWFGAMPGMVALAAAAIP